MKIARQIMFLDVGLRILGITFDRKTHLKIVFLMKLIRKKKSKATIYDVVKINDKIKDFESCKPYWQKINKQRFLTYLTNKSYICCMDHEKCKQKYD